MILEKEVIMHKNIPVIISSTALIVAIIVAIFGNNISDRFRKAQLIYLDQKFELRFPPNLRIENTDSVKNIVPNVYRELSIKNIGAKPSTNLKITIDLDGDIFDFDINCIETLTSYKYDSSHVEIILNRLSKNADINCKIWLVQNSNTLTIKSIDDQGIEEVKKNAENNDINYVRILAVFFILLFIAILSYQIYLKPLIQRTNQLVERNNELETQNEILTNQVNDLQISLEDINEPDMDIVERLRAIVNEHDNLE